MQCKFFPCASSATRIKKRETAISDFDHVKPHCLAVANAKFVIFLPHVAKGFECLLLLWAFSHANNNNMCKNAAWGQSCDKALLSPSAESHLEKKMKANSLSPRPRCVCGRPYLRKQSVRVVVPDTWLSPLTTLPSLPGLSGQNGVEEPGRSKLMSQNGSIVVETPLWETEWSQTPLKEARLTVSLSLWGALQLLNFKGFGISIAPRGHSGMTENRAAPVCLPTIDPFPAFLKAVCLGKCTWCIKCKIKAFKTFMHSLEPWDSKQSCSETEALLTSINQLTSVTHIQLVYKMVLSAQDMENGVSGYLKKEKAF